MSPEIQALVAKTFTIALIVITILISANAFGDWRSK